ncbi:hypothetical protein FKW77_001813 [Venturia effusa]|uniref:COP9 signalosome complex subunit 6 n=1 Tax=Venturia effusa TaxID=50376 RepID=A0A517LGK7_9PEZI|nr:hypothetical protein FKW77_001813 [Venturia effusa]
MAASNPLVASTPSDTTPQLHPLVLLNISDYVARHKLRGLKGPIAGAILGQQNGREVTMEVAFDCKIVVEPQDGSVHLDQDFFEGRLEMYKECFKAPQLDLVGWYTIGSTSGPEPRHLPIQMQLQTKYSLESAILLLFHPEMVAESSGAAGKLPLTLYETTWASDSTAMEVDAGERNQSLKFRELRYSVESGEAEMISVDYVARGGGNATAVETKATKVDAKKGLFKGKAKETDGKMNGTAAADETFLSAGEDELITALTAKANAIKMLQARLNLLSTLLGKLPASYLTDSSLPVDPTSTNLNQPILRSISALLARLPLLTPPDTESFTRETQQTSSDVELISLLSSLTRGVQDAKELGRKWIMAEPRKGRGGGNSGAMSEYIPVPVENILGGDPVMY